MSIGFWISLAVILFVVGNVMGLKPKKNEVLLGDFRMQARKVGLGPKLVARPTWISSDSSNKMLMQYSLINERWRHAYHSFVLDKDTMLWQEVPSQSIGENTKQIDCQTDDCFLSDLPILPYVDGVLIKSNAVLLFWHDELFVKNHPHLTQEQMLETLMATKQWLNDVSERLNRIN